MDSRGGGITICTQKAVILESGTRTSHEVPKGANPGVLSGAPPVDGEFVVPRPVTALTFTGERMTSAVGGQIAFEHFHRYCLARDLVAGLDVLDVASGEGYGSALLAGVARSVVGVEIDADTVRHAEAGYPMANLRFLAGDALDLPLPDGCVDAVVSFETLEHLRDQERFLAEIRRVLRPGGLLLISTPDRHVYSAPGQPPNPYHCRELTVPEFHDLLAHHFAHHRLLAQRAAIGSIMAPLDGEGAWRTYESRGDALIEAESGLSRAFYLVGIASDGPLPPLRSSLFCQTISIDALLAASKALSVEQSARADADAAREAAERDAVAARAEVELARRATARVRLEGDTALRETRRQAAELQQQIDRIRFSMSWRLTAPLRFLARRFPRLARLGRRAMRATYWTLTGQLPSRIRQYRAACAARCAAATLDLRAALGLPPALASVPAPEAIVLPDPGATPRVSVIIPTYGQVDFTLRCLASIADAPPAVPVEVLVVDDASGDPRVASLAGVRNLRLTRREQNLGFLRSCNAAAKEARGELLFFLNNDTEVMPGAIDALVRLLEARPDAGMVGSRLLYPDGVQQEAGGIVWRDGSAWNYGNRDDPRKPEYNYVREADYISGAAIMLPRARWDEMGGFDEAFLPAYCEDSDLAFRLRAAGWKVLYQPQSIIIHHEGVSHGTDTTSGIKAHQVANTRKLFDRWRDTLARESLPSGERVMRARDRSIGRKVTLVIDHYVPQPDQDAGSRSMVAFMEALLATGRVVKFFPANGARCSGYTEALQQRGIEVLYGPWAGDFAAWIEANGLEIDEVLLSRPSIAVPLLPALRHFCRAPVVFYGHDLHFARMRSTPGAMDDAASRAEIDAMEAMERSVWRSVDEVLYPSQDEADVVRALEPGVRARAITAYALPTPAPVREPPPPADGGLIFVGGFAHPPNQDAAVWFVRSILPLVRARHPGLKVVLAGSHPSAEVRALAGDGVEVTGFISDEELGRRYAAARVAVCPLRIGAGVKLKVVEGMHRGLPVVTTPVGVQGLPGLESIVDVAEEPAALADALIRLLEDDDLWRQRVAEQTAYVAAHFSPAAMRDALDAVFADAALAHGHAA